MHTWGQPPVCCRDLKPENFLLSDKAENAPLKATDFGLSVFYKPGQVFTDVVGSAYYVAPEVTLPQSGGHSSPVPGHAARCALTRSSGIRLRARGTALPWGV